MRFKKTVLLTNDDGIDAFGIKLLYEVLKDQYTVVIVAPKNEQSGVGHSFTYNKPVFFDKISGSYAENMYSVSGSPADCVKIALKQIMSGKPDIIVSGLNIGENSGISSHYSGTVAAAREGSLWKIRSLAFSICEESETHAKEYAIMIPELINTFTKTNSFFLNINFPSCSPDNMKGIKITKQSKAFFDDSYKPADVLVNNKILQGYTIYGKKVDIEEMDEYDSRALLNRWITVTPLSVDATAYDELEHLKEIEKSFLKGSIHVR